MRHLLHGLTILCALGLGCKKDMDEFVPTDDDAQEDDNVDDDDDDATEDDDDTADDDDDTIDEPYRIINYYPRDHAWEAMWEQWDDAAVAMDADMATVHDLGANTVRLFIHPSQFGWDEEGHRPSTDDMEHLEQALELIRDHDLRAMPTLFDLMDVTSLSTEDCLEWMEGLFDQLSAEGRDTVAVWELKNEFDLTDPLQLAWTEAMFPSFKNLAADTPVSLSISMTAGGVQTPWGESLEAAMQSTDADFFGIHWYPPNDTIWLATAADDLAQAVAIVQDPSRLILGEIGYTTSGPLAEGGQAQVVAHLFNAAADLGIDDVGVWILHDFPDGTWIGDGEAPVEELGFGLLRLDGTEKQAAATVREMFTGGTPDQTQVLLNNDFEQVDPRSGELDGWIAWTDEDWFVGDLVQDTTVAHGGSASARITVQDGMTTGMFQLPAFPVDPAATYTLTGWARKDDPGAEVQLVLSWFSWDGEEDPPHIGNSTSPITANPEDEWFAMELETTVPDPATIFVQIFVHVSNTPAGTSVWIDDLSLTVSVGARH